MLSYSPAQRRALRRLIGGDFAEAQCVTLDGMVTALPASVPADADTDPDLARLCAAAAAMRRSAFSLPPGPSWFRDRQRALASREEVASGSTP